MADSAERNSLAGEVSTAWIKLAQEAVKKGASLEAMEAFKCAEQVIKERVKEEKRPSYFFEVLKARIAAAEEVGKQGKPSQACDLLPDFKVVNALQMLKLDIKRESHVLTAVVKAAHTIAQRFASLGKRDEAAILMLRSKEIFSKIRYLPDRAKAAHFVQ
jgi:hypothetical protein